MFGAVYIYTFSKNLSRLFLSQFFGKSEATSIGNKVNDFGNNETKESWVITGHTKYKLIIVTAESSRTTHCGAASSFTVISFLQSLCLLNSDCFGRK